MVDAPGERWIDDEPDGARRAAAAEAHFDLAGVDRGPQGRDTLGAAGSVGRRGPDWTEFRRSALHDGRASRQEVGCEETVEGRRALLSDTSTRNRCGGTSTARRSRLSTCLGQWPRPHRTV